MYKEIIVWVLCQESSACVGGWWECFKSKLNEEFKGKLICDFVFKHTISKEQLNLFVENINRHRLKVCNA